MEEEIQKSMMKYAAVLETQQFDVDALDYAILDKHLSFLNQLDVIKGSYISIFDLCKREHIFLSKKFESTLGYNIDEAHKEGTDYFDRKVYPEDLNTLIKTGTYFLKLAFSLSPEKRKDYKLITDYRILNGKGEMLRVVEQFQGLELDKDGNVWLALCFMDISSDQDMEAPFRARLINVNTGELFVLPNEESEEQLLSSREMEVLDLIAKGFISKQIADKLFISVHTVNTHRQRIIEKLNVTNTFEAINYAKGIKMMN